MSNESDPVNRAGRDDAARLHRLFEFFGATQCHGRSAVDETLSRAAAADSALLGLLLDTPGEQRRPSLLFVKRSARPCDTARRRRTRPSAALPCAWVWNMCAGVGRDR